MGENVQGYSLHSITSRTSEAISCKDSADMKEKDTSIRPPLPA